MSALAVYVFIFMPLLLHYLQSAQRVLHTLPRRRSTSLLSGNKTYQIYLDIYCIFVISYQYDKRTMLKELLIFVKENSFENRAKLL